MRKNKLKHFATGVLVEQLERRLLLSGTIASLNSTYGGSFSLPDSDPTQSQFMFPMNGQVGDPPLVTASAGALSYAEGTGAFAVDPGISVSDAGSTTLASATVTISTGYAGDQDVLAFTDSGGITGNWNAATGTLTLSGTAGVSAYQNALQSVTYADTSDSPSTAQRIVSFTVNDGALDSNVSTRTINVTAVIAAPVITGISPDTGVNSTDGITKAQNLKIDGTAEANSTLRVTRVGDGVIGTCTANGSGDWSFDYTGTTLPAGSYSFTAIEADAVGNISPISTAYNVTIDTSAPVVTVNTLTTANSTPTLTGTITDAALSSGIAGVSVLVNGQTLSATVTGTTWSATLLTGLPGGTYNIVTATATDIAGNSGGGSGALKVTYVDLTGALGPTWTLPTSIVAGKSLSGRVSVVLSNLGNVALPTGQRVNVDFVAHDTTNPSNPDITLLALNNQSVSALAAGGHKTFTGTVRLATGLPADNYEILANIVPVQALAAPNVVNSPVTTSAHTIISATPFVDLTGTFGPTWTLPTSVVAGKSLSGRVSVVLSNLGNVAAPTGQRVNVDFVAHDTTNPSNPDITLFAMNNQSISALAAGGHKTFTGTVSLATGLAADNYEILANIVPVQALTPPSVVTGPITVPAHTIISAAPFVDLTGTFGPTWTLPASVAAGKSLSGSVSVVLSNLGNVAAATGQLIDITFVARDTTNPSNPDITLLVMNNQSVSALAAGGSKTFIGTVSLPTGLLADSYQILANIVPVQALTPPNVVNSPITTPAQTIISAAPFVNLTGTFGPTWTLPTSIVAGQSLSGSVSVILSNLGNVAMPTGQTVNITFIAHDTTNPVNPDIVLLTLSNQSVSALAAGGNRTFTATVNLSTGLPADNYEILANIVPVQALAPPNVVNSPITTPAQTIISATPFADLTGTFGPTWTLPTSIVAGQLLFGSVSVVMTNLGNAALPTGQLINITFVAHDTTNPVNPDITLLAMFNQSVSALAAGGSQTFTGTVSLPAGLPVDNYQILANVVPVQTLTPPIVVNSPITTPEHTIVSVTPFVTLAGAFGPTWTLPNSVMPGKPLSGNVSVVMSNLGNAALPTGQLINITFIAHDTTNPVNSDITLLVMNNQSVSALAAGGNKTFTGTVNLPTGLPADSYQILANIVPVPPMTPPFVVITPITTPVHTIISATPFMNLTGAFGPTWTLPESVVAGKLLFGNVSVVLSNLGNVALPAGQMINITFVAHDTTNPIAPDITLLALGNQSVSGLPAGGSKTFTATVSLAAGLPADNYQILANIVPVPALTLPNVVTSPITTPTHTIVSAAPFVTLGGVFGSAWTLPGSVLAGRPLSGNVSLVVSNLGNVALPTGQLIDITFIAHDTTNPVISDVTLLVMNNLSISALPVGATRTFTGTVSLPTGLVADVYQIEAIITPVNNLTDFDASYTVITNAFGQTMGITVT